MPLTPGPHARFYKNGKPMPPRPCAEDVPGYNRPVGPHAQLKTHQWPEDERVVYASGSRRVMTSDELQDRLVYLESANRTYRIALGKALPILADSSGNPEVAALCAEIKEALA